MTFKSLSIVFLWVCIIPSAYAQDFLSDYLTGYTYESRKEMKISIAELKAGLIAKEIVLVDIRFEEEQAAWRMPFAVLMPLPTLPESYAQLDKSKIIVTACPHKDRAILAMLFLKSKGYKAQYLKDGLLELAESLRGDEAKDFMEKLE
ncbi:MAG: rhodanese-like domain-containing protein [Bernardetiaceae bacterium]|nr:rhodanese-like domain-containing protein [Bernardetiaceae bacterium]